MQEKPSHKIFDLKTELPVPENQDQEIVLKNVDLLSQKVAAVLKGGNVFPEAELHYLFQLQDQVVDCAQAGCALGFIYLMLGEYNAMSDIYTKLILKHGEYVPFLYYKASAERELGHLESSLELLKKIIASGTRNYWVYMDAAYIQRKLELFKDSIASANLAIMDNEPNSVDPFVILAYNFQAIGEVNRMLETFSRIESLKGKAFLEGLGDIYDQYGDLYQKVGKMIKKG